MGIVIAGTGAYLPEKVLTNADLEKMVDTNDEWIVTRTGIARRHIAAPEQATSDLAIIAIDKALEAAGGDKTDIQAIIIATTTPDTVFPNTACLIKAHFGINDAFCIDVSSACTGFIAATEIAYSLMKAQPKYRRVLVVGAEKLSAITDWTDRNTCVLFGDGAGAVVLENRPDVKDDFMLCSELNADGNWCNILKMPAGGSRLPATAETVEQHLHFIHMEGKETFKLAVNAMVTASTNVLSRAGVAPEDIAMVIPHQANIRIIQAVAKRLDVPEERVYCNIENTGNTSAASIVISLDDAVRTGKLKKGDLILITSFGGGLTWGAMLMRY